MNKRMVAAVVALAGIFVASYLALYKLGYIGNLVCAVGSCEVVQTSKWATAFGYPVAVWGVVYYVGVLAIAIAGLTPALTDSRRLSQLLVVVTATGVLVSLWLTYLELFVIDAICQWCVVSAVLAVILLVIAVLDLREVGALLDERLAEAMAQLRVTGYGKSLRNTSEVSLRAVRDPKK